MKTTTTPAYTVRAQVTGQNWRTKSTTLTANSEQDAREKAARILRTTDAHTLTVEPVTVHSSETRLTSESYPYGSLRCTAFYSVEYNAGKGARTVFQTINPKTGRINAPKKSTYTAVILPMTDARGHFDSCGYLDFNGSESINTGLQFMSDFHDLFTPEQIKDIATRAVMMSKVNAKAMVIYAGSDWEALKPLIDHSVKILVEIANTGANLWASALLNVDAIEATKKPDFNPFRSSEPVRLSTLTR